MRAEALAAIVAVLVGAEPDNPPPIVTAGPDYFDGSTIKVHAPTSSGANPPSSDGLQPPELPSCADSGPGEPCTPVIECNPEPSSPTGYLSFVDRGIAANGLAYPLETLPCQPPETSPLPQRLPAQILRAFQRVPLPQPHLDIQPPKGKTLIGLETIFSTKADSFTRTLNLLGRRVELRITATSFDWRHGDDTTQQTDWPGRPWRDGLSMDSYITHVYEHTGNVTPTVAVTWTAEYRVDNGPWLPVNGAVTRTSQPTALQIVEAEPRLVAP